jgi:hypothetical protein
MFSSPKLVLVALLGLVFGTGMFIAWLPRLAESDAPIATGNITARVPITEWGVPRVDFTIELADNPQVVVHAHAQRYLIDKVPQQVRFRYTGDPAREVFLFEHEENPVWIALVCWSGAGFLLGIVYWRWRTNRTSEPL